MHHIRLAQARERDWLFNEVDLREGDKRELEGATGWEWRSAWINALSTTHTLWLAFWEDELAAVFGLRFNDGWASPWMLCTPVFSEVPPLRVMKVTRDMLQNFHSFGLPLYNTVCLQNTEAVSWLKFIGAQFIGDPYKKHSPTLTYQDFELCVNPQH